MRGGPEALTRNKARHLFAQRVVFGGEVKGVHAGRGFAGLPSPSIPLPEGKGSNTARGPEVEGSNADPLSGGVGGIADLVVSPFSLWEKGRG